MTEFEGDFFVGNPPAPMNENEERPHPVAPELPLELATFEEASQGTAQRSLGNASTVVGRIQRFSSLRIIGRKPCFMGLQDGFQAFVVFHVGIIVMLVFFAPYMHILAIVRCGPKNISTPFQNFLGSQTSASLLQHLKAQHNRTGVIEEV